MQMLAFKLTFLILCCRTIAENWEAQAAKPAAKREFKVDTEKAEIVKYLADHLSDNDVVNNVEVVNPNRLISFSLGDSNYEVTLVRKKKPKN